MAHDDGSGEGFESVLAAWAEWHTKIRRFGRPFYPILFCFPSISPLPSNLDLGLLGPSEA